MVSCLLLLRDSHIRVRREGGINVTACGMSLEDEHVGAHLFAADPREATCPSCIAVRDRQRRPDDGAAPIDPRAFALWFIDMLNRADVTALAGVMQPEFAARVPPARLVRLHALFPGWRARVEETIAQGDCIVVRYDVDFGDPARLLGERAGRDQAIVLRLRGSVLTDVTAIVDDFDLWARARQPEPARDHA